MKNGAQSEHCEQSNFLANLPVGKPITAVSNGHELLVIPENDLKKVDQIARELREEEKGAAEMDGGHTFSWYDAEDTGAIVAPPQQAIAIYQNPKDEIVIRQEAGPLDTEDAFVIVHQKNLQAIIDRLCDLAGIPSVGC